MAKNNEKALAKRGAGGAITKWDEEMAKYAVEVSGKEAMPTGKFVSTKGGVLSIAGQPIKDNKMQVVIVDHIFENTFYKGEYDPDNVQPPVCYAFDREEKTMAPHDESAEKQHDTCTGCPQNVFGSAEKGRGKACKNSRRLAIISADGLSKESVRDGELVYMKLPVTSTKGWAFYVKGLATTMKRPPFGVITEVSVVPDPQTQIKVVFRPVGNVPNDLMPVLMKRREEVMAGIAFPYGKPTEQEPKAKGKSKGGKAGGAAKVRKF